MLFFEKQNTFSGGFLVLGSVSFISRILTLFEISFKLDGDYWPFALQRGHSLPTGKVIS